MNFYHWLYQGMCALGGLLVALGIGLCALRIWQAGARAGAAARRIREARRNANEMGR